MQVSHTEDHATHAVISANVAREVTMSADAALMHMLSSLIYKNPMLAMVRETICNAWDAHIDAGITDRPILVTLLEGKLKIRDYGKGIHDDSIAQIYGVYGGSTKRNDSMSTGGFGIGCKSPWSYVDHFQVTSNHQGMRWIYTMSKASPETNGKPNITPIVSMPTTESGLEVCISIKPEDRGRIEKYVNQIALLGGHLTLFKSTVGEPVLLKTHKYSSAKDPFIIHMSEYHTDHKTIFIKYGSVVYPVPNENDYAIEHRLAIDILERLKDRHDYYSSCPNLILIAPPDSLSLTPSREELSLQGKTVSTVKNLLTEFVKKYKGVQATQRRNYFINKLIKATTIDCYASIDFDEGEWAKGPEYILSRKDFIERLVQCQSRINSGEKENMTYRLLKESRKKNQLARSLIQKKKDTPAREWYYRKVYAPMVRILEKHDLPTSGLHLLAGSYMCYEDPNRNGLVPLEKAHPINYQRSLHILNNVVILAHNQNKIVENAMEILGDAGIKTAIGAIVYVVPRKKEIVDKARSVLEKSGKVFVDLTLAQVIKPKVKEESEKPTLAVVAKPTKPDGYPCISQISRNWEFSPVRIKEPKAVIVLPRNKSYSEVLLHELNASLPFSGVVDLLKGKVTIVTTRLQAEKLKEKFPNMIPVKRLLLQEVINRYPGTKRMNDMSFSLMSDSLYSLIAKSKKLKEFLELPKPATEEESNYWYLLNRIKTSYLGSDHVTATLKDYIEGLNTRCWEADVIDKELNSTPLLRDFLNSLNRLRGSLTPSQDEAVLQIFNLVYKEFRSESEQ